MPVVLSDFAFEKLQLRIADLETRVRNLESIGPSAARTNNRKIWVGQTDAAINKGSSGNVSLYTGKTKGSETDSGNTVSCYNRFADVAISKWVHVEYILGSFELSAAEC